MLEREEETVGKIIYSAEVDHEALLHEDIRDIQLLILRMTVALVGSCRYCHMISPDFEDPSPIYCSKASDNCYPQKCSVEHCFSCGEYKSKIL
ncbi:hypothetical protein [Paenibacillus sp.]|uniref:hypothetical protein n=1 Tax=Paenibacillus sp. TaxID=58172 RepID=UPI002D41A2D8|nr:hypothetical protein [Paenibacillus sp.]HZG88315.1 hypothetical protein [Paenibacillus sp.]